MRIFKWIDFCMQPAIAVTALLLSVFGSPMLGIPLLFLGLLAWNLLSLIIHLFLPLPKKLGRRRLPVILHTLVILLFPLSALLFTWPEVLSFAYIVYAITLAFYYLFLCHEELKYLNDLRDQIRLSDVQHH